MKIRESEIRDAVSQLPQGISALHHLFYKLGYDYDTGTLPISEAVPGAKALCAPPKKVARSCGDDLPVLWFPLDTLDRAEIGRLVGFFRRFYPHGFYLFSNRDRQWWEFVCLPEGKAFEQHYISRFDINSLTTVALQTISQLALEDDGVQESVVLRHGRLASVLSEANSNSPSSGLSRRNSDEREHPSSTGGWQDVVTWWLGHIGKLPLLSAEEEMHFTHRAVQGDEKARHQLVVSNFRLVVSIAQKYKWSGFPLSDLIQEGNIGLLTAAERFDPGRGYRFSTYATHWIRQAIVRATDNKSRLIRLPSHINESLSKINQTIERLEKETGNQPTASQIAAASGMSLKKILFLRSLSQPFSLDTGVGDDQDTPIANLIPTDDSAYCPTAALFQQAVHQEINASLETLNDRERTIILLRFGLDVASDEPMSLEEIGQRMGVSRERVRQIETAALHKLRRPSVNYRLRAVVFNQILGPQDATEPKKTKRRPPAVCTEEPIPVAITKEEVSDSEIEAGAQSVADDARLPKTLKPAEKTTFTTLSLFDVPPQPEHRVAANKKNTSHFIDKRDTPLQPPLSRKGTSSNAKEYSQSPRIGVCQVCEHAVELKPTFTGNWYRCSHCRDVRVVPRTLSPQRMEREVMHDKS
jgi:RNA polymerase primary sigma factor